MANLNRIADALASKAYDILQQAEIATQSKAGYAKQYRKFYKALAEAAVNEMESA